ncbi:MAG: DHHW family protein [Oscillospiraceae bacterium]|nr:DHHW family protein [Oscillospiraceae bacterium]
MKKLYLTFLAVVLLFFTVFGFYSLIDKDDEISKTENRGLTQKPSFTLSALLSGDYMEELETYYTDQFPLRDQLMKLNAVLNRFYYYSVGDDGALIINTTNNAGAGGIGSVQEDETGAETTASQETGTDTDTDADTGTETGTETTEPAVTDPALDNPENAETVNSLLVVGDRAMEIVYGDEALEASYAQAVNNLAAALGSGVKTYSLVVPNSTQFYGPESVRTGSTDQETQINYIYSKLSSSVTAVDGYSKLRSHVDEYLYFRSDHHWTALGAYYAYTAFCESAGFEPVALDQLETGLVTETDSGSTSFLGTLYTALDGHEKQRQALEANPDTVSYYLPTVDTNATSYSSLSGGELQGAWAGITTVAKSVADPYLYMAFIGGDQPIEVITTDVDNDKVCMVLKESYGNAFVPFLTNHYSKVVVVDPRKFNTSDTSTLLLSELAKLEGVTDLLVINYPFMPQNEYYITRLNRLAGQ